MFSGAWIFAVGFGLAASANAQTSTPHAPASSAPAADTPDAPPQALMSIDPYEAYAQGRYADAFDGFANLQVKRPKDVDLMLNVGATLYRLKDYAGAEKAWSLAAEHGDPNARAQALYDMGNSAVQQKHLEQAIKHYQSALGLNPQDEDAKHNLRVAKKRLEEQKQQQDKNQDPNAPQDPNQKSEDNPSQNPNAPQQPQDANQAAKSQNANQQQSSDANSAGQKPQSHEKSDAQDKRDSSALDEPSAAKPQNDDGDSPQTQPEPKPGSAEDGQKTKRMPRSQAERLLDALNESRPRHAPSNDKASQRPPDGMDW